MKKLFCIFSVILMFSVFTSGCGQLQDAADSVKNVNESIQNINKSVQDVTKSIQDTGNQQAPNKETQGSGEPGSGDNTEQSDE